MCAPISSVALHVLRAIEEHLLKDRARTHLWCGRRAASGALRAQPEAQHSWSSWRPRFGVTITMEADETVGAQHYAIYRGAIAEKPAGWAELQPTPDLVEEDDQAEALDPEAPEEFDAEPDGERPAHAGEAGDQSHDRKRRRRRRRRGGRDRDGQDRAPMHEADGEPGAAEVADEAGSSAADGADGGQAEAGEAQDNGGDHKKRRRGKRGGKRNRREGGPAGESEAEDAAAEAGPEAVTASEPPSVAEWLHPGVFVEEVPTSLQSIEGVETSSGAADADVGPETVIGSSKEEAVLPEAVEPAAPDQPSPEPAPAARASSAGVAAARRAGAATAQRAQRARRGGGLLDRGQRCRRGRGKAKKGGLVAAQKLLLAHPFCGSAAADCRCRAPFPAVAVLRHRRRIARLADDHTDLT